MPTPTSTILGQGVYSVSDAARYARLSTSSVDRWVFGYRNYPSLVNPDVPRLGRDRAISFLALIELCLIGRFKGQGVPPRKFRQAATALAGTEGITHPFAFERVLRTDGRDLFAPAGHDYVQLTGRRREHLVWKLVVEPFFKEIDFEREFARRWYPPEGDRLVVLDPAIRFGQPVLQGTRIPTGAVADQVEAGDRVAFVAKCYDLTRSQVEAARRFELRYKRAA